MTREEQKSITDFIRNAVAGDLPPMDVEADAIIRALFVRNPEAAYRITILAMRLQQAIAAQDSAPTLNAQRAGWLVGLFRKQRASNAPSPVLSTKFS